MHICYAHIPYVVTGNISVDCWMFLESTFRIAFGTPEIYFCINWMDGWEEEQNGEEWCLSYVYMSKNGWDITSSTLFIFRPFSLKMCGHQRVVSLNLKLQLISQFKSWKSTTGIHTWALESVKWIHRVSVRVANTISAHIKLSQSLCSNTNIFQLMTSFGVLCEKCKPE